MENLAVLLVLALCIFLTVKYNGTIGCATFVIIGPIIYYAFSWVGQNWQMLAVVTIGGAAAIGLINFIFSYRGNRLQECIKAYEDNLKKGINRNEAEQILKQTFAEQKISYKESELTDQLREINYRRLSNKEKQAQAKKMQIYIDQYRDAIFNGVFHLQAYPTLLNNLKQAGVIFDIKELDRQLAPIQSIYASKEKARLAEEERKAKLDAYWSHKERELFERLKQTEVSADMLINQYLNLKNINFPDQMGDYEWETLLGMAELLELPNSKQEIEAKTKSLINKLAKKETSRQQKLAQEKAKQQKAVEDKAIAQLNKYGIKSYVEQFVLNVTSLYDKNAISKDEYQQKVHDLCYLIKHKNQAELEINQITSFINTLKSRFYTDDLSRKLQVTVKTPTRDVVTKYIEYFGKDALASHHLRCLGDLIGSNKAQATALVKQKQTELAEAYRLQQIEQELMGNSQAKNINFIDNLNGYEFEDYLRDLFSGYGFEVEATSYSGDYGADLIIKDAMRKIVIQAKNYSGNVGNKAVQEVVAAKAHYNCDIAMVITNSYYTRAAQELAATTNTILIDRDSLEHILKEGKFFFLNLLGGAA